MKRLRSIIILDDEPANNVLMRIFLQEDLGFTGDINAFVAVDPCMSFLEERVNQQEAFPDLLLLDVNIPGKGGFDFLAEYHERGYQDQFPTQVILLSAYRSKDTLQGAESYSIVIAVEEKKVNMETLAQKIRQHFSVG
jgi:CheY-like chemotaxis protein